MCRFSELGDYDGPHPRYPHLRSTLPTWAIPVDTIELASSVLAFEDVLPQANTLKLIHRYRPASLLARLPPEILGLVIQEVQEEKRKEHSVLWKRDFQCFQQACFPEEHFLHYNAELEWMWRDLFLTSETEVKRLAAQGMTDYYCTEDQKVEMVRDWIQANRKRWFDEYRHDMCSLATGSERWLARTCSCAGGPGLFRNVQDKLQKHFGLKAVILHEGLMKTFQDIWPREGELWSLPQRYTRCFLTFVTFDSWLEQRSKIYTYLKTKSPWDYGLSYRLADCPEVDPLQMGLKENHQARFMRAMCRLNIGVRFHLSELKAHLHHPIRDKELQVLCHCPLCQEQEPKVEFYGRRDYIEALLQKRSRSTRTVFQVS